MSWRVRVSRRTAGYRPVSGSLVEEVEGVVRAVDGLVHDGLGLEVLEGLVGLFVVKLAGLLVAAAAVGAAEGLATPIGAGLCDGGFGIGASVVAAGAGGLELAAAVADDVLFEVGAVVLGLALAAGGREEALFRLAATANAGRVVRVVDTTKIAAHLAAATRDASLVDAFVLGIIGSSSSSSSGGGCSRAWGGGDPGLGGRERRARVLGSAVGRGRGTLLRIVAGLATGGRVESRAGGRGRVAVLSHVVLRGGSEPSSGGRCPAGRAASDGGGSGHGDATARFHQVQEKPGRERKRGVLQEQD